MERAWALLRRIAERYQSILGENLTGLYAHGSLAFGCFRWDKSDIDFLVVTEREPSLEQKRRMIEALLAWDREAPPKGFEMSVVMAEDCRRAAHPSPYSLHFSNAHKTRYQQDLTGYCREMHGVDPDLIAHYGVTRAVGRAVCGLPVEDVFGAVQKADYLDSIRADLAQAERDVTENPVYVILNLCRALAYQREGLVLSKAQGGAWGMERMPEDAEIIRAALHAYTTEQTFHMDAARAADFAARQKARLFQPGEKNSATIDKGETRR